MFTFRQTVFSNTPFGPNVGMIYELGVGLIAEMLQ